MIAFPRPAGSDTRPAPASHDIPVIPATPEEADRLGDEIATLAGHIHAASWRLLMLLHAFDRANDEGRALSQLTTAEWFSWRTGIAPGAAREKVRVARLLPTLPHISDAMRSGRLSYSKVRELTRVATPENEAELTDLALIGTAAQVQRLVRAWKRVDRLEDAESETDRHGRRELQMWVDEDGSWAVKGRLDPEVGALLRTALDAAARQLFSSDDQAREADAGQRRADAIGLIAERALGAGFDESPEDSAGPVGRADRFQVIVHVEVEGPGSGESEASRESDGSRGPDGSRESDALPDEGGGVTGILESVGRVPSGTWRRLSCDASRVTMTHAADGSVLDVGRRTRTIPPAIRRALNERDKGCRFPGCNSRFADAHHIEHWADGGRTSLENLVLLCRRHHRSLHEGGFEMSMAGGEGGTRGDPLFRFTDARGRAIPIVPFAVIAPGTFRLERAQHEIGIDADTTTPTWGGESFDVGWALDGLRHPGG